MLNSTSVENKINLLLMHVVPKSRHVLAFFTQNINIKCCEFLCQVVQKYVINNLLKKKLQTTLGSLYYSIFICYFLRQLLHNHEFTKELR